MSQTTTNTAKASVVVVRLRSLDRASIAADLEGPSRSGDGQVWL